MSEKKIKVKGSSLVFDPSIKELSFIFGERFVFNFNTQKFELDTNPQGDPKCIPVTDWFGLTDGIQFTVQNKDIQQWTITSSYPLELSLFKAVELLQRQGFVFEDRNSTKIEVLVEKGKLKSIRLVRIEDYSSKDFLTLLFEKEQSFVIKYPFQKLPLNKAYVEGDNMICETPEEIVNWQLLLPDLGIKAIRELLNVGLAHQ